MKILLINHFPLTGSGSGVYTYNIAKSLAKLGNEVCIIFPENELVEANEKIKLHPVYFNGVNNGIPFNFPCFTTHPRSTKTFYELTSNELNIYKDAFRKAIEEEIRDFQPDVIHSGHIWTLSNIAGDYNIPLVITAHGTDLIGFEKSDIYKEDCYLAYEKAQKIITISKDNKNLVDNIFGSQKSELIPNGYDPEVFYPEVIDKEKFLKQFGITKPYKNIVSFAGKFTKEKGIDTLLKALKLYENDDTITILAGDGELFNEMIELKNKLGINNVVFIKNQPHNILRQLYNVANISIVPSRKEAFGLVVIEALACKTPVIGTNTGGIKDIINERVGRLIEVDDYIKLAENVKYLLDNEPFDYDYIASYAKDKYAQDQFTNKLIALYNEVILEKNKKY